MDDLQLLEHDFQPRNVCSILGGIVGAVSSAFGAASANRDREDAATTSFNRQRSLFGERYQLQMKDMKAAGLNPILAYRQSPPGVGGVQMAPVENVGLAGAQGDMYTSQAGSARQQEQLNRDLATSARENRHRIRAERRNIEANTRVAEAEEILRGTNITRQSIQNAILLQELQRARAGAASAREAESFYNTRWGQFMRWLDLTGGSINPFASAAESASRTGRGR